jgi:hypothetical protein
MLQSQKTPAQSHVVGDLHSGKRVSDLPTDVLPRGSAGQGL